MAGSRSVDHRPTVNSSASAPYAIGSAVCRSQVARITPTVSGPSTTAASPVVKESVFAAGTWLAGTSLGMIALRVGLVSANAHDCTAVKTSSTHGSSHSSSDCTRKPRVPSHITAEPAISSLRRSIASARAPPHRPKTSRGTRAATPSRPTQNELSVNENISTGTATAVNW